MNNEIIYEGKAKILYKSGNEDEIILYYKDDTTALNGLKKEIINNKGILNNKITTIIYNYLINNGIKTHYIKTIDDRSQLVNKVNIIPLEVILRNKVAGSMAKTLAIEEGTILKEPILEICYKDDALDDPLINDYHALALNIVTRKQLTYIYEETKKINQLLINLFKKINIDLIDFKLEFGLNKDNEVILADEISPDCMRLWDISTQEKLDKDVFRREMGSIVDAYQVILDRLEGLSYEQ